MLFGIYDGNFEGDGDVDKSLVSGHFRRDVGCKSERERKEKREKRKEKWEEGRGK